MDAVRGLLAPWTGGAAAPRPGIAPSAPSGVRSMQCFWMGGACVPVGGATPATQAAVRSMQAFWVGGATAPRPGTAPPIPPTPQIPPNMGGGTGFIDPRVTSLMRTRHMPGMREIIEKDDEIILEVIVMAVTKDMLH